MNCKQKENEKNKIKEDGFFFVLGFFLEYTLKIKSSYFKLLVRLPDLFVLKYKKTGCF